jgi:hypothetical protein
MGKHPQIDKGVSKLQYYSFRKTGSGAFHFEGEGITHSLPSSHKNVKQSTANVPH